MVSIAFPLKGSKALSRLLGAEPCNTAPQLVFSDAIFAGIARKHDKQKPQRSNKNTLNRISNR